MTTALTLIEDALGEIGVKEAGQSVSSEDAALALRYLNRVLQRWSNHRLLIPSLTEVSVPLDGSGSYTIGPSGADVTATRPNKIISGYVRDSGGLDYPLELLTELQWQRIGTKTQSGPPCSVWYEKTSSNGTLHVYPDVAGYTLKLQCQVLLSSFATTSTSLTLPEGYESALVYSLACDVAGQFGRQASADLLRKAAAANRSLRRTNSEPIYVANSGDGRPDIERGY